MARVKLEMHVLVAQKRKCSGNAAEMLRKCVPSIAASPRYIEELLLDIIVSFG